jgi:hypothetical protein
MCDLSNLFKHKEYRESGTFEDKVKTRNLKTMDHKYTSTLSGLLQAQMELLRSAVAITEPQTRKPLRATATVEMEGHAMYAAKSSTPDGMHTE